jgi:CoA:oxalate CoA-transferase
MQPLAGFHVLDLTHAVSGPTCTHQLRLLGADVIKVEKPEVGDDMRHYTMHAGLENMSGPFIAYNSGKRSITLDLKNPKARPVIDRLVSQADVVVENFRPGVAAQMKLDAPSMMERNPKLVYCSISGFGQTGRMRNWPAYDHIVQAISGMMMMNGSEGQEPIKVGVPLADCFSGYCAAFAITSALLQRERTGQGQVIDVAMLDALLVLMNAAVVTVGLTEKAPHRSGNLGFRMSPTSTTYRTQDGYLALGANHPPQIARMAEILGVEELFEDPRFATEPLRLQNRQELSTALAEIFGAKQAEKLEPALASAMVPAGRVRDLKHAIEDDHFKERETFVRVEVPGLANDLRACGTGFSFAHDGPHKSGRVPSLGEHTDAILDELGFSGEEISTFHAVKAV